MRIAIICKSKEDIDKKLDYLKCCGMSVKKHRNLAHIKNEVHIYCYTADTITAMKGMEFDKVMLETLIDGFIYRDYVIPSVNFDIERIH